MKHRGRYYLKLVARPALVDRIEARLRDMPAVLLLGPRQCGKTTLARTFADRKGAPQNASRKLGRGT